MMTIDQKKGANLLIDEGEAVWVERLVIWFVEGKSMA